jgi:hypothetical protein
MLRKPAADVDVQKKLRREVEPRRSPQPDISPWRVSDQVANAESSQLSGEIESCSIGGRSTSMFGSANLIIGKVAHQTAV